MTSEDKIAARRKKLQEKFFACADYDPNATDTGQATRWVEARLLEEQQQAESHGVAESRGVVARVLHKVLGL